MIPDRCGSRWFLKIGREQDRGVGLRWRVYAAVVAQSLGILWSLWLTSFSAGTTPLVCACVCEKEGEGPTVGGSQHQIPTKYELLLRCVCVCVKLTPVLTVG